MPHQQHLIRGQAAEAQALKLLEKQGLELVTRNFRTTLGEIDLIMLDQQYLVIVEVRYRKSSLFGTAAQSVNTAKQRRIIATTQQFLKKYPRYAQHPIRFDIVALQADQTPEWIQDAFQAS